MEDTRLGEKVAIRLYGATANNENDARLCA